MNRENKPVYEFGLYQLDIAAQQLRHSGQPVSLPPKAFEVLVALVERSGELIEKDDLLNAVWKDTFVEEGNLKLNIHTLRKALAQDGNGTCIIETIPKRGYRFAASVKLIENSNDLVIERLTRSRLTVEVTEEDNSQILPFAKTKLLPLTEPSKSLLKNKRILAVMAVSVFALLIMTAYLRQSRIRASNETPNSLNIRSMAVLPFGYIGEKKTNDDYLKEGLPDALITRLSYLPQVKVRPTSATRKYIGSKSDSLAIGRELGVDAVLEGTIRREGERVRVNVQLVRVADGSEIWSESFNDEQVSLIALEETMAARVVTSLSLKLNPAENNQLSQRSTQNREAYEAYLKGRFFWNKRSGEGFQKAEEQYQKAIAADPDFALAYTGLADINSFDVPGSPGAIKAEEYAQKAIRLNPNLAEPHATLGFIYCFHKWDWQRAEEEFRQSIALNQNYPTAHHWYAIMLGIQMRFTEAESEMRKALEIDPLSLSVNADLCQTFYFARRYDEAITQCRKTLEIDNEFQTARSYLREVFVTKEMYSELMNDLRQNGLRDDDPRLSAFKRDGKRGYHQFCINELEKHPNKDYEAYMLANSYARIGDKKNTLRWLDRAYQTHNFMLPFVNDEPAFDVVREDPRFIELIKHLGLSQ